MDRQTNTENKISDASLSEYLGDRYENRQDEICRSTQMCHMLHELVVELHFLKLNTIGKLEKALDSTKEDFERYEEENPRSNLLGSGSLYFPIEIVIISMQLLFVDFPVIHNMWVIDPDILAKYKKGNRNPN